MLAILICRVAGHRLPAVLGEVWRRRCVLGAADAAPAVVLETDNAALFVAKIPGIADAALREKVLAMQEQQRQRLYAADKV